MPDADSILASGWYTDRRGREWHLCDKRPACAPRTMWYEAHPSVGISGDRMRALIERDLHRDVCPGLRTCYRHPVPNVVCVRYFGGDPEWGWGYEAYPGICADSGLRVPTLPEAIDAAIELAKEEA